MSELKIPEDLQEMYESSKLDQTMFVGSQIRQLIGRIAQLEAQLAEAQKPKWADLKLRITALEAQLAEAQARLKSAYKTIEMLHNARLAPPTPQAEVKP